MGRLAISGWANLNEQPVLQLNVSLVDDMLPRFRKRAGRLLLAVFGG
jgi:hypothetical protein